MDTKTHVLLQVSPLSCIRFYSLLNATTNNFNLRYKKIDILQILKKKRKSQKGVVQVCISCAHIIFTIRLFSEVYFICFLKTSLSFMKIGPKLHLFENCKIGTSTLYDGIFTKMLKWNKTVSYDFLLNLIFTLRVCTVYRVNELNDLYDTCCWLSYLTDRLVDGRRNASRFSYNFNNFILLWCAYTVHIV